MKFNRKHYGMKRRSSGGQAILEYIIIIALVAVAALTVLGLFGDRIKALIAGTTTAIGGQNSAQAAGDDGDSLKQLQEMDKNGPSDINF
jgi:Flp pilus assembly pilin Flp